MRKYYLKLCILLVMLSMATSSLWAQMVSFESEFETGDPTMSFTAIVAPSTFATTTAGGIMTMTVHKTEWHFAQWWVKQLNLAFKQNPFIKIRVKADKNVDLKIRVKDDAEHSMEVVKQVTTSWQELTYDFSALLDPAFTTPQEVAFDFPYQSAGVYFDAAIDFDFFKLGLTANPNIGQGGTGYQELFNGPALPAGAKSNSAYSLSWAADAMTVNVNRSNRWYAFDYELGGSFDIVANPYLNLKVKADQDLIIQAFLIDETGMGYETELIGSQYKYDELVANKNEFRQARIYKSSEFVSVGFDFTGYNASIVDLSKIVKIKFVANGTGLTFNGKFYVDELSLGDKAVRLANIGQVGNQLFMKNTAGQRQILVPDLSNVESLALTGATNLISNVQIAPITYTTVTENGFSRTYGYTKITFDLKADAVGEETVTLTGTAKAGYQNNAISFKLKVTDNNQPTISTLPALSIKVGDSKTIALSNISDGDPSVEQSLIVTATSSNTTVADNPAVTYTSPSAKGSIAITAKAAGSSVVKVVVKDNGGSAPNDTISTSFVVNAYTSINQPPVVPQVANQVAVNTAGQQTLSIPGITDGDNGSQTLTIDAVSSDPTIAVVDEIIIADGTATFKYTPQAGKIGSTTIAVTVTDNGGNANNDGDKSTVMTFTVSTKNPSDIGYEWPNDKMTGMPTSGEFAYSVVTFDGSQCFKVDMTDKWTYAGVTYELPIELDLTETPVIQYDIYSVDQPTWHWNYFWDAFGYDGAVNRNIANSTTHQYEVPANQWTTLTFDYRDPGDLNNDQGNPIAIDRIKAFLLNVHGSKPTWPFTNTSGTFYLRNIRIGNKVQGLPQKTPVVTVNPVPNQNHFVNAGEQQLVISGLSNGKGGVDGLNIAVTRTNTAVVGTFNMGAIQPDGTAVFTYNVMGGVGSSSITMDITAEGSTAAQLKFSVITLESEGTSVASATADKSIKYQTIHGLGTFQHSERHLDLYTQELGASAMRLGIIGNQWEPVNDNNDPNVLNMDGFDYSAFNWDWIANLKERGVETFILTSWSPPAWMKRNLSLDSKEQAIEWSLTDNILEPYYYEEYAESMEAIVIALKERAGVDLYAIGLQNEPAFNEPYPSAILSPAQFKELIKVVGKRFKDKGIATKLYMPEQVTGIGFYHLNDYLDAIQADAEANQYVDIFACHGYGSDGITAGFPSYTEWNNLWTNAQEGDRKKEMWMTETHIGYTDFSSAMKMAGALHGALYAGNISLWTNWGFEDMQLTKNVPNSSFYTSMNYFKFIRPGAKRIKTETSHPDVMVTGFENTDGSVVFVLINKNATTPLATNITGSLLPPQFKVYTTSAKENFASKGSYYVTQGPVILAANSVTTLVGKLSELAMDAIADVAVNKGAPAQTVDVTGITNGAAGLSGVTLEVKTSDATLTTNLSVSSINSTNGTAIVSFTPATNKMGTATITLTLKDADDNSIITTFKVVVGNTSNSVIEGNGVRVYPNPVVNGPLVVSVPEVALFNRISIRDVAGRLVYSGAIEGNETRIDVSSFGKGVYFVTIEGEIKKVTERVMIK